MVLDTGEKIDVPEFWSRGTKISLHTEPFIRPSQTPSEIYI
jgi:hypothetical protein